MGRSVNAPDESRHRGEHDRRLLPVWRVVTAREHDRLHRTAGPALDRLELRPPVPAGRPPDHRQLALRPQDLGRLGDIQHDTTRYLVLLIPIGWGTAVFGEELVFRGFLNTRLATGFGGGRAAIAVSVAVQALLFGLGHAYLGPRGIMNAAAIGLVSGGVYWANGRNLWPLVIAHGLVDSVGLTLLRLGVAHQG